MHLISPSLAGVLPVTHPPGCPWAGHCPLPLSSLPWFSSQAICPVAPWQMASLTTVRRMDATSNMPSRLPQIRSNTLSPLFPAIPVLWLECRAAFPFEHYLCLIWISIYFPPTLLPPRLSESEKTVKDFEMHTHVSNLLKSCFLT